MAKSKRIWGTLDPFYEGGPVMGRIVANTTFLDALLKADPFEEYHFFLPGQKVVDDTRRYLQRTAPDKLAAGRIKLLRRFELPRMLGETDYYCFHQSDCMTTQPFLARLRNRHSKKIFPITGVIHSLSYTSYMDALLHHLWPGTTARDCIVCSSLAGMQCVANYFSRLRQGLNLGPSTHPAPVLERIPLGVNVDAMTPAESSDGPVRLLVFGRISHHSKMDVVPLIRAVHRLVQDGLDPSSLELVLAGWADKDEQVVDTLTNLAANAGIALKIHLRPDDVKKDELFRSADVFVSIADNPQETFGITLVEAGAYGLPVLCSDYDGYRDIVESGTTGLLVPTTGPAATPDMDMMAPLLFDNEYHLHLAQRVSVDVERLAEAVKRLVDSPELRRKMGKAARKRVEREFAWSGIMDRYSALWSRLWREKVEVKPLRKAEHPMAPAFGQIFGHYTTHTLAPDMLVQAGRTGDAFYHKKDFPNVYAGLHDTIDLEIVRKLVFFARKPVDTATLMRKISDIAPETDVPARENHILWALKHDILQRIN